MDNDFATGYALGADANDNRNSGWGCDGGWIWIFLIFAMFGWGGNGFGGFGGNNAALQGALTRADLCNEFNANDLKNGVRGITQGICDSTFALNNTMTNGFHGVDNMLCSGFNNINSNINQLGYQMQDCCCQTQGAIKDVRYDLSRLGCNIIQAGHNDADRIISRLDLMETNRQQERIHALELENQKLSFAASQSNQNAVIGAQIDAMSANVIRRLEAPQPVPAYVVPNPNNYAYNCTHYANNGCGC